MRPTYPLHLEGIAEWARENRITVSEARVRFAQYAILRAIASSRLLHEALVFKGGNALDFIWQPNRSTSDLDFSLYVEGLKDAIDPEEIRRLFTYPLATSSRALGIGLRIQGIKQKPPGESMTYITYEIKIAYALPDQPALRIKLDSGQPVSSVIKVEISTNEIICEAEDVQIDDTRHLRVSTIEDIVAEKLRALLQQSIRNRARCQDLLDIAVILRAKPQIDRIRVTQYLRDKAMARSVLVSHSAFHDPELARRARQNYGELESTTRFSFIQFDEALVILLAFTDELPIPEN